MSHSANSLSRAVSPAVSGWVMEGTLLPDHVGDEFTSQLIPTVFPPITVPSRSYWQ